MGKGEIQSHLGDGQYSVRLQFNRDRALAARDKAQERADELEYEIIPDLEGAKDEAETTLNQAETDLNTVINSGDVEAMEEAQGPYLEALEAYSLASQELSRTELELASLNKKILTLTGLPAGEDVYAWCADLTTDLSGEVGTVEIPGERQHVMLRPGYDRAAVYDQSRDGQIFPIKSTTPAATFYNLAMMPGWQKWRPQYRLGEITAIDTDTDTCDVSLDTEKSHLQDLNVNQASILEGIPVEYMSCNAAAFEVGDRVLVEFEGQEWSGAKVVGFESQPRPCALWVNITLNGYPCTKSHTVRFVQGETSVEAPTDTSGVVQTPVDIDITEDFYVELYSNAESGQALFVYYQQVDASDPDAVRFVADLVDKTDADGDWKQTYVGFDPDFTTSNEIYLKFIWYKRYATPLNTSTAKSSFTDASGETIQGVEINFDQLRILERHHVGCCDGFYTCSCNNIDSYNNYDVCESDRDISTTLIEPYTTLIEPYTPFIERYVERGYIICSPDCADGWPDNGYDRIRNYPFEYWKTAASVEADLTKFFVIADALGQSVTYSAAGAKIYFDMILNYETYGCTWYEPTEQYQATDLLCSEDHVLHADWEYMQYVSIDTPPERF